MFSGTMHLLTFLNDHFVVFCDEKSSVRNFPQKMAMEKWGKVKAAKESF